MPANLTLLVNVMGAVCLLLWGSMTVRDAVRQGFSAALNRLLSTPSGGSPVAAFFGALVAILTQSATATILLTVNLVESGLLGMATAVAVVLGADLGSAFASRILYLDLSLLPPVLIVSGLALHMKSSRWRLKCVGRILLGLGLMLLSIAWIREAIAPFLATPISQEWLSVLRSASWVGAIVVALLTWFGHSSVAAVLVIATLDQGRVLPLDVTMPMLLGANIGAALIALPLVMEAKATARSVVFANLVCKGTTALVLLVALPWLLHIEQVQGLLNDSAPGVRLLWAHIAFNTLVLLIWILPGGAVARRIQDWLEQRKADRSDALELEIGAGLDAALVDQPADALAQARREALRLGDAGETLFSRIMAMFDATDHAEIHRLVRLDAEINSRNKVIHRYLSAVRRHVKEPHQEQELDQILQFSSTMEDIGDAVCHDLARLALKRLDRGVAFSDDGLDEITRIHEQVLSLLRGEINAFASNVPANGPGFASRMVAIQQLCHQSISKHRLRLSSEQSRSVASSSIHQDTVRDLLQIALLFQRIGPTLKE